jgi:excisionase family DNA binding protein
MAGVREKLLTASDLAALCEVDLKTIHNWVDRGRIAHFRTPGRHLRFKAADVAEFLRAWGYSVPRELARATSKSMMAIGTKDTMAHVARSLGESVPIRHANHPYDALIYAGSDPADVYIVDVRAVSGEVDPASLFEALHRACAQGTFVALSDEPIGLPPFVTRVGRSDTQQLKMLLLPEALLQGGTPPLQAAPAQPSEEPPRSVAAGGSSR